MGRSHITVKSAGGHSTEQELWKPTSAFTLEKNHTSVQNAVTQVLIRLISSNIWQTFNGGCLIFSCVYLTSRYFILWIYLHSIYSMIQGDHLQLPFFISFWRALKNNEIIQLNHFCPPHIETFWYFEVLLWSGETSHAFPGCAKIVLRLHTAKAENPELI